MLKNARAVLGLAITMLAMAAAGGWAGEAAAADVTGTWNVAVTAQGPHGDMTATLTLTQDDTKVTGTLAAHGNEHKLAGQFADATLTLEATDVPADKALSLTAKLQADGTLAGYLSGPMGDLKWTASRAKGQR
jgi:hypothetical protein